MTSLTVKLPEKLRRRESTERVRPAGRLSHSKEGLCYGKKS